MNDVISITGPILIVIGIGYLAVRFGLAKAKEIAALGRFVVLIAFPAMMAALPAFSIYSVLADNDGYGAKASFALLVQTALSFVTLTALLYFLRSQNGQTFIGAL